MIADRDDEASFVYFPSGSDQSGLIDSFYLAIPCAEDTTDILVCPGIVSLAEVTEDCSDRVTLTSDDTEVGNYWWGNFSFRTGDQDCYIGVDVGDLGNGFGAKAI